jgi:hypothetical protein
VNTVTAGQTITLEPPPAASCGALSSTIVTNGSATTVTIGHNRS